SCSRFVQSEGLNEPWASTVPGPQADSTYQTSAVVVSSSAVLNTKRRRPQKPKQRFNCSFCDRSFASFSYQQVHETCYHAETPQFGCSMCNKLYKYPSSLSSHIKRVHGK